MSERHTLQTEAIIATIDPHGAELVSLAFAGGPEMLWQAGPIWPRHAPILFPIVGRLAGDTLRVDGRAFHMGQHGFARDSVFGWGERAKTHCRLVLKDTEQTRGAYPFAFRFEVAYAVSHATLLVTLHLTNTGDVVLPASMGAHPAFVWPLAAGIAKTDHTLTFGVDEPGPIRRVSRGLLRPEAFASPIRGRGLKLDPALFEDDALILDPVASHNVVYAATDAAPRLTMSWSGFPQLGMWSKPDADFLCLEPWHGFASPEGFDGDIRDKPGIMHLAPHTSRIGSFCVTLRPPLK